MNKIGMALTEPRGKTQRRDQYGIYEMVEAYGMEFDEPSLYSKYEGYREQDEDGEVMVGLPGADNSGAQRAAHQQSFEPFHEHHFATVKFFKRKSS